MGSKCTRGNILQEQQDAGVQPQRTIGKSDQEAREATNEGIPVIGDLLSQGWTVSSNRRRCCFGQLTRTITRVNPFPVEGGGGGGDNPCEGKKGHGEQILGGGVKERKWRRKN